LIVEHFTTSNDAIVGFNSVVELIQTLTSEGASTLPTSTLVVALFSPQQMLAFEGAQAAPNHSQHLIIVSKNSKISLHFCKDCRIFCQGIKDNSDAVVKQQMKELSTASAVLASLAASATNAFIKHDGQISPNGPIGLIRYNGLISHHELNELIIGLVGHHNLNKLINDLGSHHELNELINGLVGHHKLNKLIDGLVSHTGLVSHFSLRGLISPIGLDGLVGHNGLYRTQSINSLVGQITLVSVSGLIGHNGLIGFISLGFVSFIGLGPVSLIGLIGHIIGLINLILITTATARRAAHRVATMLASADKICNAIILNYLPAGLSIQSRHKINAEITEILRPKQAAATHLELRVATSATKIANALALYF
jgi:hypothetical protein